MPGRWLSGITSGSTRSAGSRWKLLVEGIWFAGFGPGATGCSVACAQDPQTARLVLTEAFESGLAGR